MTTKLALGSPSFGEIHNEIVTIYREKRNVSNKSIFQEVNQVLNMIDNVISENLNLLINAYFRAMSGEKIELDELKSKVNMINKLLKASEILRV